MVRKHKLLKTFTDLKLDKQVRDPMSVRSKIQSNSSSKVVSPPMICHGSETCSCLCHYAKDDPPPCYTCCQDQDQDQPVDCNLAKKVLLGKKDSLSRGSSYHLKDYVLRDEFGCEIPRYRKKINRRSLHLSKVMNDESSTIFPSNAKDSLRIHRKCFPSQIDDLNIENLSIAPNKSAYQRIKVNNIFNSDSHLDTILTREDIENRLPPRHQPAVLNHQIPNLQQHHSPAINHRMPTQCGQQLKRSARSRVLRDEFGLEMRDSSREGCTVS